jgi:hypothetical protein
MVSTNFSSGPMDHDGSDIFNRQLD